MAIRHVLLGAATASFVTVVATATPSLAQPTYPPTGPAVTVSSTVVTAGDSIVLSGSGFLPNSTVTIRSFVGRAATAQGPLTGQGAAVLPQARAETAAATVAGSPRVVPAQADRTHQTTTGDPARDGAPLGDLTQGDVTQGDVTQGDSTDGRFGHGHHRRCSTGRTCRVQVDAEGDFSTQYALTRRGLTAIWVRGQDAEGARAEVTVTVRVRGGGGWWGHGHHHHDATGASFANASNSGLAMTGTPVVGGVAAGVVMLLAGSGLLVGLRRRRRQARS